MIRISAIFISLMLLAATLKKTNDIEVFPSIESEFPLIWKTEMGCASFRTNIIVNKGKSGWRSPTDDWMVGSKEHPSKNNSSMKDYFRSLLNNKEIMDIFEITKDDIENRYFN